MVSIFSKQFFQISLLSVLGSYCEPNAGWIDNLFGPTGMIFAIGKGVQRLGKVQATAKVDLVPVDYCANAVIAASWRAAALK